MHNETGKFQLKHQEEDSNVHGLPGMATYSNPKS
jgi:hypothetical protein